MTTALLLAALLAAPTIIDNVRVESAQTTIPVATVVIDQGHIVAVHDRAAVSGTTMPSNAVPSNAMPSNAVHIDGAGKVLTPGLVETLSQIGIAEVLLEPSTVDSSVKGEVYEPAVRAADAYNPLSVRIPIARAGGLTSVIVSPIGGVISGTGVWIDLTGSLKSRPDGTRPAAMFGDVTSAAADGVGGSRSAVWTTLRQVLDDARLHRRSAGRPQERTLSLPSLGLEALYPVIDGRLPLVLGADRASDILAAIEFAKAEKLRLVIAGGAEAWLVTKALREAHVPVIVQPHEQLPYGFDLLNARDDLAGLLDHEGVTVIISTGTRGDQNARRLRYEAGLAVALGMPRQSALRAITAAPAEVFDRGALNGTIAVGKRADLVLWSGDPFELSTVAEHVWIEGNDMPLATRQRQLAERYLQKHD